MGPFIQWLLRRGGLYILLVLAVAFGPLAFHAIFGGGFRSELMSPGEVSRQFQRNRSEASAAFKLRIAKINGYSQSAVNERLQKVQSEFKAVSDELKKTPGWLASMRPRAILERKELELRQAALGKEISLLKRIGERYDLLGERRGIMAPTALSIAAAKKSCEAANVEVRSFNARYTLERSVRAALFDEAGRLTQNAETQCSLYKDRSKRRQDALLHVQRLDAKLLDSKIAYAKAGVEASREISRIGIDLAETVQSVLIKAAVLLFGIVVTPFLIRLVFYFILAPLAERRPAIRLPWAAGSKHAPWTVPQGSASSAPIKLETGEELVVRQGFLQSTSIAGAKGTRALLDWRHPLSSLASGLVFLTHITGEGETTVVSAVNDPFAEVAVLELPLDAACVLQPRALVAIVQVARQPLRITSHWRLGSLHAWLSLQLRYLVFHGPARLVIKGGRGVRFERAERGRVFGQDQLVGFSADLAYSVTRTETFWPYFIGLQPLLKDKVEEGEGVLIVEEAPMAAGDRASSRKGLEGAADVLLKAVGL